MDNLQDTLKNTRESKGLLLREVAALIETDTALISKFEKGERRPTREQLEKYAEGLGLKLERLVPLWISEKIYNDIKDEPAALKALQIVKDRIKNQD